MKQLLALLVLLLLACTLVSAQVLNVPQRYQEQNQWCWAGCTQANLAYFGKTVTQTDIAWHGSRGENIWIWLWGQSENPYRSSIQNLLTIYSIRSTAVNSSLDANTLASELANGRPVQVRWGWDSGGGHFVICRGLQGSTAYIMDPWSGPTVNDYSWLVRGGGHTWTHTLLVNR
jgi:hypothetical protein